MKNIIIIMTFILFIYKIQELCVENKEKNKNIDDFIKNIEVEYKEIKKVKSNYKKILLYTLKNMKDNDLYGLQKFYYENIINDENINNMSIANLVPIYNIKIPELRSLILSKLLCEESNKLSINIICSNNIDYICKDKIKMIANVGTLIDNSINIALEYKEPEITINFEKTEDNIKVIIMNTFKKVYERGDFPYKYLEKDILIKDRHFTQELLIENQ
ncbi:MAG: hypothetical protein KIB43_03220 [Clostridium baratii]|uniref:hypothetical protein n=1 Tax=Clostridium baratii TaxID=1561 RepID=UPI0006C24407|nr:hypothetical protein [Clostridium baratii]MBS6005946.1 hypothetical protein [Clostridium baratii]MDU1053014.1 hypothetical protein [Clostridium baratii]MDU4911692.1 hypothetical protein [Clostridium baratii]CUP17910.1 sensor histidine kinase [Clostridium baratii]